MANPLPLAGVVVVDYSHFLAGPHLSRCLAAMGAEVIKVERPRSGDAGRAHAYFKEGQSGYFLQQNMGKKGLCVDLKDPRGLEMLHRLVKTADVFVENYRPGALDRLGLGYEALSKLNPGLVYCSVSAYGHTGPDASKPGFGLIAEAKSGALAQVGSPGERPPLLRMPIADMYAGLHGVAAVSAALFGRTKTGMGRHIDIALYDCMVSMHDYAVQRYTLSDGAELPAQTGHDQPESTVYGVFPAQDGYLVIAAQVDDAWRRLALLIGGDALATDARFLDPASRNAHRLDALALVQRWCMAQASKAACIAALDAAQVPCAPVQTIDEVIADPQIIARDMIIEQDHPVLGKVRLLRSRDTAPRLDVHETECGYTYISTRNIDDNQRYVRVYQYIMPAQQLRGMTVSLAGKRAEVPKSDGHIWTPIDDEQCWVYNIIYGFNQATPITPEYAESVERHAGRGVGDLIPGTFRLKLNPSNDYMIDREMQKTQNYTGIKGVNTQDFALQENMGRIVDRSREHLGSSDKAIVKMRRLFAEATDVVESGGQPRGIDPKTHSHVRAYDKIVTGDIDWKEAFARELVPEW